MPPSSFDVNGSQIDNMAQYLRYLCLTEHNKNDPEVIRSAMALQEMLRAEPSIQPGTAASANMSALIIGINNYASPKMQNLKGAVADAIAMKNYLENTLGLPASRIRMLTDEQATRQNIIDALFHLESDDSIRRGDAILIYYAGHGEEVILPLGGEQKKIESMVPSDFDGQNIHVIPDYTLGQLVYRIGQKRGDNITVIFDCCHSGSGTRTDDPDHLIRAAYLNGYSIPPNLDAELGWHWGEIIDQRPAQSLFGPGLSSHVLLAACSANEKAGEEGGRGKFTKALESALKAVPPDQISYVELLARLENIVGQNPQLEGNNRHRMLFNSKVTSPHRHPYEVHTDDKGTCILHAGAADCISEGAEFAVYASYASISDDSPLGTIHAEEVGAFETVARSIGSPMRELSRQKPGYAVQIRAGEQAALKIYIPMTEDLKPAFMAYLTQRKWHCLEHYQISLVENKADAHLELQRDGHLIRFFIRDPFIGSHGMIECLDTAPAEETELRSVLQRVAHYTYHLNHSYPNPLISKYVKPEGEDLIKNGAIHIDVAEHDRERYGISITNSGGVDLYPNLFYFDNSDLSITDYFLSGPRTKYDVDAPLPALGGKLTLGFGAGGGIGPAFEYYIPEGRDMDVGFLKCFFSTSPVDLWNIPQASPFTPQRAAMPAQKSVVQAWGSVTIPMIQTRKRVEKDAPLDPALIETMTSTLKPC